MKHEESWGQLWESLGGSTGTTSQGVTDTVSRICIYLICFILGPGCCPLDHSMSSSHVAQCSEWGEEKKGPLWQCLTQGSWALIYKILVFPVGGIMGQEVLLVLCCAAWGRGRQGESKTVPLIFISVSNLGLFLLNSVLELLWWTPRLYLVHGWLSKLLFFGGKMVENFILLCWWCHPPHLLLITILWHVSIIVMSVFQRGKLSV